ncbi:uncharacterized protein BT62DRAFT_1006252 [Guyanagaster necrorhizus]|uniref:Uncharacterized protein n=1 Tax=Guyanagaster necrorhizus TaxID=856835 RepID=A0A9P7VRF1_9AGAR|nr:uncharacterized protein BT62DRAFT_1006252 [Guyanagaster necrorhizus MCA 3950]KAG7446071.1 hypothetical protein BT62DRAFT_1006252 [Guyanagaster necrorhizus MCA 3950]
MFGPIPTIEEMVNSIAEEYTEDLEVMPTDEEIVAAVKHDIAVENGEITVIDDDEEEEEEEEDLVGQESEIRYVRRGRFEMPERLNKKFEWWQFSCATRQTTISVSVVDLAYLMCIPEFQGKKWRDCPPSRQLIMIKRPDIS